MPFAAVQENFQLIFPIALVFQVFEANQKIGCSDFCSLFGNPFNKHLQLRVGLYCANGQYSAV